MDSDSHLRAGKPGSEETFICHLTSQPTSDCILVYKGGHSRKSKRLNDQYLTG